MKTLAAVSLLTLFAITVQEPAQPTNQLEQHRWLQQLVGEWKLSSEAVMGPGGQSVNTTDSAVRIIHLPTNISVFMQDEKSQHKNKAKGLRIIRSRVYEHYQSQLDEERADARRTQTGSGDRSQRIRTYNFPQNRCTDHRLGKNFSLDRIIDGELRKLFDELTVWGKQQELGSA